MKEKELLEKGYKKEMLVFGISEYNPVYLNNMKTLEYDMRDDFTLEQIATIKTFVNVVNGRFLNVKLFIKGDGYIDPTWCNEQTCVSSEKQNPNNGNNR